MANNTTDKIILNNDLSESASKSAQDLVNQTSKAAKRYTGEKDEPNKQHPVSKSFNERQIQYESSRDLTEQVRQFGHEQNKLAYDQQLDTNDLTVKQQKETAVEKALIEHEKDAIKHNHQVNENYVSAQKKRDDYYLSNKSDPLDLIKLERDERSDVYKQNRAWGLKEELLDYNINNEIPRLADLQHKQLDETAELTYSQATDTTNLKFNQEQRRLLFKRNLENEAVARLYSEEYNRMAEYYKNVNEFNQLFAGRIQTMDLINYANAANVAASDYYASIIKTEGYSDGEGILGTPWHFGKKVAEDIVSSTVGLIGSLIDGVAGVAGFDTDVERGLNAFFNFTQRSHEVLAFDTKHFGFLERYLTPGYIIQFLTENIIPSIITGGAGIAAAKGVAGGLRAANSAMIRSTLVTNSGKAIRRIEKIEDLIKSRMAVASSMGAAGTAEVTAANNALSMLGNMKLSISRMGTNAATRIDRNVVASALGGLSNKEALIATMMGKSGTKIGTALMAGAKGVGVGGTLGLGYLGLNTLANINDILERNKEWGGDGKVSLGVIAAGLGMTAVDAAGGAAIISGLRPAKHWWGKFLQSTPLEGAASSSRLGRFAIRAADIAVDTGIETAGETIQTYFEMKGADHGIPDLAKILFDSYGIYNEKKEELYQAALGGLVGAAGISTITTGLNKSGNVLLNTYSKMKQDVDSPLDNVSTKLTPSDLDEIAVEDETFDGDVKDFKTKADDLLKSKIKGVDKDGNIVEKGTVEEAKDLKHAEATVDNEINNINEEIDKINKDIDDVETGAKAVSNGDEYIKAQKEKRAELEAAKKEQQELAKKIQETSEQKESIRSAAAVKDKIKSNKKKSGVTEKKINEAVDKIKKAKNNTERTAAIKEAMDLMDLDEKEISAIAKDINERNDISEEDAKKSEEEDNNDDDDDGGDGGSDTTTTADESSDDVDIDTTASDIDDADVDTDTDIDNDIDNGTSTTPKDNTDESVDESDSIDDADESDVDLDNTAEDVSNTTDGEYDGSLDEEDIQSSHMRATTDDSSGSKSSKGKATKKPVKKGSTTKKDTKTKGGSDKSSVKKSGKSTTGRSKPKSTTPKKPKSGKKSSKKTTPVKKTKDSVLQALMDIDDSRALVYYLGLNSKKGSRAKKISDQIYDEVEIVKFDSAEDLSLDNEVLSNKTGTRQATVSVVDRYTWWIDEEGTTHYFAIPKDSEASKTLKNMPQKARDIYNNELKGAIDSITEKLGNLSKDPSKLTKEKIREVQAEIAEISKKINDSFDELGRIAQIIRILTLAHPNTQLAKSFGILAHNINLKITELDQSTKQLFELCKQYKIDAKPFRMESHKDSDTLTKKAGRISRFASKLGATLRSVFGGVQDKITQSELLSEIYSKYVAGRENDITKYYKGQKINIALDSKSEHSKKIGYEAKLKFTFTWFDKKTKTYESKQFNSIKEAYEYLKDDVKDQNLLKDIIKTALLSNDIAMDHIALNDFFDGCEFETNNKEYATALRETLNFLNPITNFKQIDSLFQFMGSALFKPLASIFDAAHNQKVLMLRQQLFAIEHESTNGVSFSDIRGKDSAMWLGGEKLETIMSVAEDLLFNTLGFKEDISTMRIVVKEMLTAIVNDNKFWSQSGALLEQFKDVEIEFSPSMWADSKKNDVKKSKKEDKATDNPIIVSLHDLMALPLDKIKEMFTKEQLEAAAQKKKIKKEKGKDSFTDAQLDAMRATLKEMYVLPSFSPNAKINKAVQNAILSNKGVLNDLTTITKAAILSRVKSLISSNPIKADKTDLDKLHFQDYYSEISMSQDILDILGIPSEAISDEDRHSIFSFGLFASNSWLKTLVNADGAEVFSYLTERGTGPEGHGNKYLVVSKKFISDLRKKHQKTISTIFDDILGKDPFRAMSNSPENFIRNYKGFRAGSLTKLTQQGHTFVTETTNADGSKSNSVIDYFRDVFGVNVENLIDTISSGVSLSNDEYNALKNNIVNGFKNNNNFAKEVLEEDENGNFVANEDNPFLYMPINSYKLDENGNVISREVKYVYMPDFLGSARMRKMLKTDNIANLAGQHLFESRISYFTRRASDIGSGLFVYGNYKLNTRRDSTSISDSKYSAFVAPIDFSSPVYVKYSLQDSGRMHTKSTIVNPSNKILRDLASFSQNNKHKSAKDINHKHKNAKHFLADKKHSEGAFLAFAQMFGKDVDKFAISEEGKKELARIKNDTSLSADEKREQIIEATIKYARYTVSYKQKDPSTGEVIKDSNGDDITVDVDLRDLFNSLISNDIGTPEFEAALETYNRLFEDSPIENLDPFEDSPHTIMANKAIFDKYLSGHANIYTDKKGNLATKRFKKMQDLDTSKLQVLIDGAQTGVFENMVRFRGIAAFDVMSNVYREYSQTVLDEMSDTQKVDNELGSLLPHEVTDIMKEYEKLIDSMKYTGKELYYSERLKRNIDPYIMTMALMLNQMSQFQGDGANLFIALAVNGNLLTRDAMKKIVLPYLYGSNSAAIYNTIMMESSESVMSNLYTFLEAFQNSNLYYNFMNEKYDPDNDPFEDYRDLPIEEAKQMLFRDYLFLRYSLGMSVRDSNGNITDDIDIKANINPYDALRLSSEYNEDNKSLINMFLNIGDITQKALGPTNISFKVYGNSAYNGQTFFGKNAPINLRSKRNYSDLQSTIAHELQHRLTPPTSDDIYFNNDGKAYNKSVKDDIAVLEEKQRELYNIRNKTKDPIDQMNINTEIRKIQEQIDHFKNNQSTIQKNRDKESGGGKIHSDNSRKELAREQRKLHKTVVNTISAFLKDLKESNSERKEQTIVHILTGAIQFLEKYKNETKDNIIDNFIKSIDNSLLDKINEDRISNAQSELSANDIKDYLYSIISGNIYNKKLSLNDESSVADAFNEYLINSIGEQDSIDTTYGFIPYFTQTTELLSWILTTPSISNTFSSWALSNKPEESSDKTYADIMFDSIKNIQKLNVRSYAPSKGRNKIIKDAHQQLDELTIDKSDQISLEKKRQIPQDVRIASIFSNWISSNPKENCHTLLNGVFNGENSRVNYHALSKNLFGDGTINLFADKGNNKQLSGSSIIPGTIFSEEMNDINEYTQYFQITNRDTELYFDDIFKSYWKPIIDAFKLKKYNAGELAKSFFKDLSSIKEDIIANIKDGNNNIPSSVKSLIQTYSAMLEINSDDENAEKIKKSFIETLNNLYANTVDAYIYSGEFLPEHTPSSELSIPPDVRIARRSGALASIMKTNMQKIIEVNLNRVLEKTFSEAWNELRPGVEMTEQNVNNALTDATFAKNLGIKLNEARKQYYMSLAEKTFDESFESLKTTLFAKQKNVTAEMRTQFDAVCKEVLKNYIESAKTTVLQSLDQSYGGYNNLNSYQIIVEKNTKTKGFPLAIKVNAPEITMLPRVLGLYNHNLESAVMAEMINRGLVTQQVFDGWQTSAAAATDSIASWNDLFTKLNSGVVDIPTFFNKIVNTSYELGGIDKSSMSKYEERMYFDFITSSIEYSTTISNPGGVASVNIRTPFEIANADRANDKKSDISKSNDFVKQSLISAIKYYLYMKTNKKTKMLNSTLSKIIFNTIDNNIDMSPEELADILLKEHGDMITKQYDEDFKRSLKVQHKITTHQTKEMRLFNRDINDKIKQKKYRYYFLKRDTNGLSNNVFHVSASRIRRGIDRYNIVNLTKDIKTKFELNSIDGFKKFINKMYLEFPDLMTSDQKQLFEDVIEVMKKIKEDKNTSSSQKVSLIEFAYKVASYRMTKQIIEENGQNMTQYEKDALEQKQLLLYKVIKAPYLSKQWSDGFFVEVLIGGKMTEINLTASSLYDNFINDSLNVFGISKFADNVNDAGLFINDENSQNFLLKLNGHSSSAYIYGKPVLFTNQSRFYDSSNTDVLDIKETTLYSGISTISGIPEKDANGKIMVDGKEAILFSPKKDGIMMQVFKSITAKLESNKNNRPYIILDLRNLRPDTAINYIKHLKKLISSSDVKSDKWMNNLKVVNGFIEESGETSDSQSFFAPLNDIAIIKKQKVGKLTKNITLDVASNLNFNKAIEKMMDVNGYKIKNEEDNDISLLKHPFSESVYSLDEDISGNTEASLDISSSEAKRMINDAQKMTDKEFLDDLKNRRDKELSNPSLTSEEKAAIKESYDALIDLYENAGKLNIRISKESHAAKGLQVTNHNTRESSILLFANNDTSTALHEYIHSLFGFALNQSSNVVNNAKDQIYYIMKQIQNELANNPELRESLGISESQFEYIFNNPNGLNASMQEFMATFLSTPKLAAFLKNRRFNITANRFNGMRESKTIVGKGISLLKGLIGIMYDIVSLSFFQSTKDIHSTLLGVSKKLSQYNTIEGMKAAQKAWENHPLTKANKFAKGVFHLATRNIFKTAATYMIERGLSDSYVEQVQKDILEDIRNMKEPIEAIIEALEADKNMSTPKKVLLTTIGILKTLWNGKRLIFSNPVYRHFALQALNEARQQLVEGTWLDFKINIDLGLILDKKFQKIKDDVDRINNLTNATNIESEASSTAIRDEVKGIILNDGFKNLKKWFNDNEAKDKDFRKKYENSISRFTWFAKLSDFWYGKDQIPKDELKDILDRALSGKSKTKNEHDIKANINAAITIIKKKNKLTSEQVRKFKNYMYVGTRDLGYTRLARKHNAAGLSNVELMISSMNDVLKSGLNLTDKDFRDIASLLHKNVTLHTINHMQNKDLKYISHITNDASLLVDAYKNNDLKEDIIRMMSLITQVHHDSERRNNNKRELNWKEARKLYREGKNIADIAYNGRIYRNAKTFDRDSRHPFYTEGYIPYSRKPDDPYIVRLEKDDPEFEQKRQYYIDAGFSEDITSDDVVYMKYNGLINFAHGREELGYRFDDRIAMGHQNEYFLSLAEKARLDIPNYNEWLYKDYMEQDGSVFDEDKSFFKADSTHSRVADSVGKRRENIDSGAFESLTESDYTVSNLFYNQEKTIFANNTNNFINNTIMLSIIDSQDSIKSRGKGKFHKYHNAIPLFKLEEDDVPYRSKYKGMKNTKKRIRVKVANPVELAEEWGITFNRDDLANVANLLRTIGYDFTKAENKTIYIDKRTIQFLFGYNKNIYNSDKVKNGKAQKIISGGFSFLRGLVRETRNNTIIRNPSLVWENFKSNIVGLFGEGIPPTQIFSSIPIVIRQLNQYQSLYKEIKQLETQIAARKSGRGGALSNYEEAEKRLKTMQNNLKDNPLYDFMQSGGFYTNIIQDSEAVGFKWDKRLIDAFADKVGISDSAKAYIKEAALTDESSLYQALEYFTRLGDFVPRVIYANHLIEHEGVSKADAIKKARNRFINYNTPLWSPVLRNLDFFGGVNYAKYGIGMQRQVLEAFANSPVQASVIMALGLAAKASGVSPVLSPNSYLLESVLLGDGLPKGLVTGHILPFWNNLNRWNYVFPN